MKRTAMTRKTALGRGTLTLQSKSSMKRSGQIGQVGKFTGKPKRKPMRTKGPRMTPIRRAARGQDCTIEIPGVCNCNPDTVVLCHDNRLSAGKGMGLKAPDTEAAFGCSACHDVLDGRAPRPAWLTMDLLLAGFERAKLRTHEILKQKGLMP
jgi:hypothetical protein